VLVPAEATNNASQIDLVSLTGAPWAFATFVSSSNFTAGSPRAGFYIPRLVSITPPQTSTSSECGAAFTVQQVDLRAALQQQLDHPLVAAVGGVHQRGDAIAVLQVGIRAALEQQLDHSWPSWAASIISVMPPTSPAPQVALTRPPLSSHASSAASSPRQAAFRTATSHSNPECVCVVRGSWCEALSDTLGVRMHQAYCMRNA